jgi:hypothetical protein
MITAMVSGHSVLPLLQVYLQCKAAAGRQPKARPQHGKVHWQSQWRGRGPLARRPPPVASRLVSLSPKRKPVHWHTRHSLLDPSQGCRVRAARYTTLRTRTWSRRHLRTTTAIHGRSRAACHVRAERMQLDQCTWLSGGLHLPRSGSCAAESTYAARSSAARRRRRGRVVGIAQLSPGRRRRTERPMLAAQIESGLPLHPRRRPLPALGRPLCRARGGHERPTCRAAGDAALYIGLK